MDSYIGWLIVAIVSTFILQFKAVSNFALIALWVVRLPLLAVLYVTLFVNYLLVKALDPRCADVILISLTKGSTKHMPLVRFIYGIWLSIDIRRGVQKEWADKRTVLLFNNFMSETNTGYRWGCAEDRLSAFYNDAIYKDNVLKKYTEGISKQTL